MFLAHKFGQGAGTHAPGQGCLIGQGPLGAIIDEIQIIHRL